MQGKDEGTFEESLKEIYPQEKRKSAQGREKSSGTCQWQERAWESGGGTGKWDREEAGMLFVIWEWCPVIQYLLMLFI